MISGNKNFVVFIISHGRPDNVVTYKTLRTHGYTGDIRIVVDNTDKTVSRYQDSFPGEVLVFDKPAIAKTTDQGDNFNNLRTTTHARNACFDLAGQLGREFFLVLDDDYPQFQYRFDSNMDYVTKECVVLDLVFASVVDFLEKTNRVSAIALAQGGDFIGGSGNEKAQSIKLSRKCMNSFFCTTRRRFKFFSRLNEDVNTYVNLGTRGYLFFTTNQISLVQAQTQTSTGGMTEAYLDSGTYVKSFYSVMYCPSAAKISRMGDRGNYRIHHHISWRNVAPKILREDIRKRPEKPVENQNAGR